MTWSSTWQHEPGRYYKRRRVSVLQVNLRKHKEVHLDLCPTNNLFFLVWPKAQMVKGKRDISISSIWHWHSPACWRLGPDLDQNEADALQVLHVLLEERGWNVQKPGFFLQPAGQRIPWVGAVAAVTPRCCWIARMMTFLGKRSHVS